jgi:predicted AAA+ superfamily ATPase
MLRRTLYTDFCKELIADKPMVFISGPRQAGKTTLAQKLAEDFSNKTYFNWDIATDKALLLKDPYFFQNTNRRDSSKPIVIFDEIHKYKKWKNYLKGAYDQFKEDYLFLVSGSGRLDIYQKGGDSLAGRFFMMHLFPFTLAELSKRRPLKDFIAGPIENFDINKSAASRNTWERLTLCGGFPEPFIKAKRSFFNKWLLSYNRQIIREDIRDIADVKNIDNVEILFSLLRERAGGQLSINNLAGDIGVSFDGVKNWLRLLENFYMIFTIGPWVKISRAIRKERKVYLYNYAQIDNEGSRFENMAALELLRAVSNWNERGWGNFSLHYLKNKAQEEVDFLIASAGKPILLIETKLSDDNASRNLIYFQNILNIPAVQLVNKDGIFKYIKNGKNKTLIVTAHNWLASLP